MKQKALSILITLSLSISLLVGCGGEKALSVEEIDREETYPDVPGEVEVIYEELDEIVRAADVAAYVSVGEVFIENFKGFPQTHSIVEVEEVYKGNARPGDSLEVIEEGGHEGKVLGGLPQLSPEYRYVLFLKESEGAYYICGAFQGRFIQREGHLFQQAIVWAKLEAYEPVTLEQFARTVAEIVREQENESNGQSEPARAVQEYSLSELELSMIEFANIDAYIEGAQGEYISRISSDPETVLSHMDSLELPSLVRVCSSLAAFCYRPTADNTGAEREKLFAALSGQTGAAAVLLNEYLTYTAGISGEGENAPPPITGVLCPAISFDIYPPQLINQIDFVNDTQLIFHNGVGLYVYDLVSEKLVYSADMMSALGISQVQGTEHISVAVDSAAEKIFLYVKSERAEYRDGYCINTIDWSYSFGDLSEKMVQIEDMRFAYDPAVHGRVDYDENGRLVYFPASGSACTLVF